jgi:hypothetical protein
MGKIRDLGPRIELVALDPHFHDISIALHRHPLAGGPGYEINSYSTHPEAPVRLRALARLMVDVGGMLATPDDPLVLTFSCRTDHELAARRIFIEAAKLDPATSSQPRASAVYDKKVERTIGLTGLGNGAYHVHAEDANDRVAQRLSTVAGGLVKLAGMETVPGTIDQVSFACGQNHDAIVALLLIRALNARGVLREMEMAASRGVLSAPSQQE